MFPSPWDTKRCSLWWKWFFFNYFCYLFQSGFGGGWSMKYHFGNVLVSSQEYGIYSWTLKDPGCTATRKTGKYPETHIVPVKPKCLARLSCWSWLTRSGAMGTQSMPKFRHWLFCKLQDILGFICPPRGIGLKKTGRSGEKAQLNLSSCTGVVWCGQGLHICGQVVMNLGTFGCMITTDYRNCFTALHAQGKDHKN